MVNLFNLKLNTMPNMSSTAKRKADERDSPLKTQPVSKMIHADTNVISKFETEVKKGDNTELNTGIQKLKESGLEYLTAFCKLHKVDMKGNTITEIVTNMLKEEIVNDHIQIRLGDESAEKEYLWKKVKEFKSAKLEEVLERKMELINVMDPTETQPTNENLKEQIEDLKTVIKNMKEATKNDLDNLNERTKGLEKNKLWQALTNEENTLIVDKIDLGAAKDEKAAYLIGEAARTALNKLADTSYDTDSTRKSESMTLKELSENEYMKIKRMIDGADITPLAREVKAHKPRPGDVAGAAHEGILTCSLSLILKSKTEKELMRSFAKKAAFSVKDQTPKLLIAQKRDVDQYFRDLPDTDQWWIKVDIIKGRETDAPRFRVGRKGDNRKWENKWFLDITEPSIWGRLSQEQRKEHLLKATGATIIGD